MSITDAIDLKKDNNNKDDDTKDDDTPKENKWDVFGSSCLFGIVIAIITWLIASNIVFFTRLPKEILNKIFPKNPNEPPFEPNKEEFIQTKKCKNSGTVKIGKSNEKVWNIIGDLKVVDSTGKGKPPPPTKAPAAIGAAAGLAATVPGADAALDNALKTNPAVNAGIKALGVDPTAALSGTNPAAGLPTVPGATTKGGGKMTDFVDKLRKTEPKFGWPYTMMYPYNDCSKDKVAGTQSNFYLEKTRYSDNPDKFNNAVYNQDGKLNDEGTINQPETWKNHTAAIATGIKGLIKQQNTQISEGNKNEASEENKSEMKDNLKKLKAVYNYFDPSITSGRWWSQFGSNVGNWIASSTQYSFITEHRFLQFMMKKLKPFFGKQDPDTANDPSLQQPNNFLFGLVGIIVNVILTYFIIHFIMLGGTLVNVWGQISGAKYSGIDGDGKLTKTHTKSSLLYTIIFCCMGFLNFMYAFGVGIIQYIEVIYKFLMYPILNNFSEWKENISITSKYLPIIYGFFILMAAWTNLEPIYGNVMFITLLVYIIKLNKDNNAAIKKAQKGL